MSDHVKSNPLGPGTKNLSVNLPAELFDQLDRLAKRSGLTRSAYARRVLAEAAEEILVMEITPRRYGSGDVNTSGEENPKKEGLG